MRAIGVRSSDIAGVGGFVLPGDRVDVFVTRTIGSGDEAVTVTQTLAENCRVMGVDQVSDVETDKPIVAKAVTLEVTPDQAQTISLAQSVGAVTLSLRQAADAAPLARRATTAADLGLFGFHKKASGGGASTGASAKPKPKIGPGMNEVHVVRGVEATSYAVAGR